MLSWIFLIVLLAALVVLGTWAFTFFFGGEKIMPSRPDEETDLNKRNAQLALEGNFDAIAFDVAPHGYRQEQVDALLAALGERRTAAADDATPEFPARDSR